jgi:hypothetical protein
MLSNSLPDVHAGWMLYPAGRERQEHAGLNQSPDLSLSLFARMQAQEMLDLEQHVGIYQCHLIGLELMQTVFLSARQDQYMPVSCLIHGPPASEKSHLIDKVSDLRISEGLMRSDVNSTMSFHTDDGDKPNCYVVRYIDEATAVFTKSHDQLRGADVQKRQFEKSLISEGKLAFQRTEKNADGKYVACSIEKSIVMATIINCNECELPRTDAIFDRLMRYLVLFLKRYDESFASRVVSKAPNSREYARLKQDQDFRIIFVQLLQFVTGLPHVDLSLFRIMFMESSSVFNNWIQDVNGQARVSRRAMVICSTVALARADTQQFRSAASDLIQGSEDPEGSIRTLPYDVADLTAPLMAPCLFAQYDEVIWAMTRYFHEHADPLSYLLMLASATLLAGFTRAFFLPAYQKYTRGYHLGISLPDVSSRAAQRGMSSHLLSDPTDFIREFHTMERKFCRGMIRSEWKQGGPNFPPVKRRNAKRSKPSSSEDAPRAEIKFLDPNYVEINGYQTCALAQIDHIAKKYFTKLSRDVLERVVSLLAQTAIEAPEFAPSSHSSPKPDNLIFTGSMLNESGVVASPPITKSIPIIQTTRLPSGNWTIAISTHYLMMVQPYMLFLYLTESENRFTRPHSTVLPMQLYGYPSLLHRYFLSFSVRFVIPLGSM